MDSAKLALVLFGAAVVSTPALAAFTTVNLDGYVNGHVAINPDTLPIGLSTGNQGTDIPFLVSASPYNPSYSGVWLAPSIGSLLTVTGLSVSGQSSFYALLNNYYGNPGINEYTITLTGLSGNSVSYESIGGVHTRDYNASVFTNNIAATTTEWYNNGIGQRYDVRTFTLPSIFADDTITSFSILQTSYDNAIFAGLTFSTLPAGVTSDVPEPASWAMFIIGFGLVGGVMRRKSSSVSLA